jgi:hypothetical protein
MVMAETMIKKAVKVVPQMEVLLDRSPLLRELIVVILSKNENIILKLRIIIA